MLRPMLRILVLTLALAGAMCSQASAKTLRASAWTGKLIVYSARAG